MLALDPLEAPLSRGALVAPLGVEWRALRGLACGPRWIFLVKQRCFGFSVLLGFCLSPVPQHVRWANVCRTSWLVLSGDPLSPCRGVAGRTVAE